MVTLIQRSCVRDRKTANAVDAHTISLLSGRISACDYAIRSVTPCAITWEPSTVERFVVDGIPVMFDATSNMIRVGRTSAIAMPMLYRLLLSLAREAPEVVPYERLDDFPEAAEGLAFDIDLRVAIHKRKSRLARWLRRHEIPLKVVTVRDYGYGLRRSN